MSFAEFANLALPASQRPSQTQRPTQPANDLWTSCSPVILPPSPFPGQHNITVPSHSSSPLFPRCNFGLCASTSGDVYFYGGETKGRADELYHYSTKDNTVTPLQCWGDSPGARLYHAMTLAGDVITLHGGGNVDSGQYADPSLYLLNLVTREWSSILVHGPRNAPMARELHSMATVGTTIYMFGGTTKSPGPLDKFQSLNELWAFDLNTLRTQPTWELIKPSSEEQPPQRDETQIVPYQNQLILFGGVNRGTHEPLGDIWSFDLESRRWSELQCTGDIPPPRWGHATAVVDDVIYIVGGRRSGLIEVFALKVPDRRWFRIKNTPTTPIGRNIHCATQVGAAIFILGGQFASGKSEKEPIHVFDASRINNSDLHTPERLRELGAKFQGTLIKRNPGSEAKQLENEIQVQQVKVERVRSENQTLEKKVKDLCAELLKQNADAETMVPVKELNIKVREILTEISELEKGVKELNCENESLKCNIVVPSILEPLSQLETVTHIQGMDAQIMVDFFAELLGTQGLLPSTDRRRTLYLLNKLAKSAQVFPERARLSNVQCDLNNPAKNEGGYGFIYKGIFGGRGVCVKAVRVFDDGAKANKLLRAQAGELALLAHISHPNVIPIYGAYLSSEAIPRICIVSPWMENGDLIHYLREFPETPHIPLMCDLAVGLEFLHDMGIVHADLKARNVLISQSRRAMLADFGVSTVLHTDPGTTTAQDISGTLFWMAPELLVSDELCPPSQQSDIWGFGCVLFEALTGEIPFSHHYRPTQFIAALMKGHITPLRPIRGCDPIIAEGGALVTLAEKCWNYGPSQRPTAAEAVRFLTELNVRDDRPTMDEELATFETVRNSRVKVKVDYDRVLSIVRNKQ